MDYGLDHGRARISRWKWKRQWQMENE